MYEAITRGIRIRVEPQYLEDQSAPDESHFVWSYAVEINNDSKQQVQLKTRTWRITDALGRTEEVRGPGVVGQTPTIPPGGYVQLHIRLSLEDAARHHGWQLPDGG